MTRHCRGGASFTLKSLRTPLDIAVCGCGPAGLSSALLLHRQGHRVRIFDRFRTPQPVGSGLILQPTGLGVLEVLGIKDRIETLGARIERLFGKVVPSGRTVLDVRYSAMGSRWYAIGVHRAALFDALYAQAVRLGIEIVPAAEIKGGDPRLEGFDLVVDALGRRSPLATGLARRVELPYGALWMNIPWPSGAFMPNALEQRYRRATHMAGVLPIGRQAPKQPAQAAFFWSLKGAAVENWRARPLGDWKKAVIDLWPEAASILDGCHDHDALTFAQYEHFTAAKPFGNRIVHVGDSARCTSPQLGQGANMALLDALALAKALELHADLKDALPAYARMRRWHARLFQWASATFTPFYQSDSRVLPFVRDWLAAPLSRLPIGRSVLARLVSGMTVPPLMGAPFSPAGRLSVPSPVRDVDTE